MTTVQDALRQLARYLGEERDVPWSDAAVEHPAREARLLLAHAMSVPAERLTLLAYDPLDEQVIEAAYVFASRRRGGEPASHIIGYRAFFGREFFVDSRVLDPRPETECLVTEALKHPFAEVLDLGTGSGAIIVSLLAERRGAVGIATDVSADALQVAEQNAETHSVAGRIGFVQSDWFQAVGGTFDLIVSNPPYIAAHEMPSLQYEVQCYEPRLALTDEADGLTAYRKIVAGAPAHLRPGGRLMVEIGPTQAQAVIAMMAEAGLRNISVIPDLDSRDRVVVGHSPQETGETRP
ncbi:peptide chain release factor N(5)-glutamine methyltransferase [Cognatiyoonia sp. IB215182]|uniref:peptide chain release factor N(5)-glutamine methyltransferase n=1 Tax=Cognatiyoonia sp. IB215182 TaxID=3097353 RepID=UPI002A17A8D3|nr:peptide chain release factor N(5)-glutamine methyltransferase [Cognatiyoonia sp. IB215182]MDX8352113.1 peptide chain release factor N(5)-glutamine methyltransferase [Cognatiyoonia sp. IB215182]